LVAGQRKSSVTDERFRIVVVLDLDTVVGVIANASGLTQRIGAQGVLIPKNREPRSWTPQDLPSNTRSIVESPVRLPSVHKPGFDLQMLVGEYLNPHAIEKPRRVGGNIGRLIGPIVKVIVTKETHV